MAPNDPLSNFCYRLEIDSITWAGFTEVAIAGRSIEAVAYRERSDPPDVRKRSGFTRFGNITLTRGLAVGANALDLFRWYQEVSGGYVKGKRKTVVIVVQNEAGVDAARFVITGAWPVKYDPSDIDAKGNEIVIDMLELANEGIECEK